MNDGFSRRRFLASSGALGAATLFPSKAALASAPARSEQVASASSADVATRNLVHSSVSKVKWQAEPFAMPDVRLLPGPFKQMMELNRSFLYSLPNDRLAHNFRVTAGIPSDADPLGGWEAPDCELRGHYVGHYLSSCALLHVSTGDEPILHKANDLVQILSECQAKDGYLGAYPTAFYDRLRRHEQVWAPFYTYHKIMAGLIDMYEHTGNKQALDMALRMADWADTYARSFTDDDWQRVLLVEQGGMMESAFNLYAITGNAKYRELAYRFEHKKIFDPLAANEDKLDGNHANTNIPKVIGAARGYELTGDTRYKAISENFYRIVTDHHAYCTGGTSNGEMWHASDAIAKELGPAAEECCCSYNMMKLARHLYGQSPQPQFFDYYERLLFNVRAGTQDRNGMLMYYVPLQPGMYKTFGTPFDAFWCCTGTGSEEYAKLTDSIYFHDESSVYVNLFIASKLDWKERGLELRQTTKFPNDERITLTIDAAPSQPTALKVRIPYWATKGVTLSINGETQSVAAAPSTYATLEHPWKAGDTVTIDIPLTLHIDTAPDDKQVQSAMYGPLVLAARLGTEGLTTSMIYGGSGPRGFDDGYPMPEIDLRRRRNNQAAAATAAPSDDVWFEQIESSPQYPLQFRTKGREPQHTLVPLSQITDERYSVYLRKVTDTESA
ncbi:beta-L-arabinofuranosidase domain-containing protein [Acidicapsa dinghuensis]|uniref:Beta-L-arabinofuranosidase domain-containing protein n=1 Tax=Acidicapsa dinghuensis TaxID=2218256 RepID=A0ABW1EJ87_9BACT|nr:beta-L-arabinofuranosidase domain-containing protein [Acidicapsa dinghuensis]